MIISTTLSGNARDSIGAALESLVHWVDKCLVIDTGITDDTLAVAREVAGDKLIVRHWLWRDDFAAARNFALAAAEEAGATWAWTLDTDERMLFSPLWTLKELESNGDVWVFYAPFVTGSYIKERIIRLGRGVRWEGVTHECVVALPSEENEAVTLNLSFTELPKTPEQVQAKNLRDERLLRAYLETHPEDPRWWVYLGTTLQAMGRYREALPPLYRAIELAGIEAEGREAVNRLLQGYSKLRDWTAALELCRRVLERGPGDSGYREFIEAATFKLRQEIANEEACRAFLTTS